MCVPQGNSWSVAKQVPCLLYHHCILDILSTSKAVDVINESICLSKSPFMLQIQKQKNPVPKPTWQVSS